MRTMLFGGLILLAVLLVYLNDRLIALDIRKADKQGKPIGLLTDRWYCRAFSRLVYAYAAICFLVSFTWLLFAIAKVIVASF